MFDAAAKRMTGGTSTRNQGSVRVEIHPLNRPNMPVKFRPSRTDLASVLKVSTEADGIQPIKKPSTDHDGQSRADSIEDFGRGERIRTSDPSVPNRVLYQAEPRPDKRE